MLVELRVIPDAVWVLKIMCESIQKQQRHSIIDFLSFGCVCCFLGLGMMDYERHEHANFAVSILFFIDFNNTQGC